MKARFIDCNDQLDQVWVKVYRADDPKIEVNTTPFKKEELPRVVGDAEIVLDDHSYMPTDLVAQCPKLKHVVFLGTGAASYMNVDELQGRGVTVHTIKGYGDTAVAEHAIALMWSAARGVARMDRGMREGQWIRTEGLELTGKTIGIQTATVYSDFIYKNFKDVATIREYKTSPEHDLDLTAGRIDAAFDDATYFTSAFAKPDNADLAFSGPEFGGLVWGPGEGLGIRKTDTELAGPES